MENHKKILYLIGYYLAVVTPNPSYPTDANAMQDLDKIYYVYVIFHTSMNHH
jgi:hypothetical protein